MIGRLFALVVVPAWIAEFFCNDGNTFPISEFTLELVIIAGRHKVVFSRSCHEVRHQHTLFRPIC